VGKEKTEGVKDFKKESEKWGEKKRGQVESERGAGRWKRGGTDG
jgi:hypothetical protein